MRFLARVCVKSRFPRLGAPIPLLDGFLHDNVRREETQEWLETGSASTGVIKGSSGGAALEELTRAIKDLQIA